MIDSDQSKIEQFNYSRSKTLKSKFSKEIETTDQSNSVSPNICCQEIEINFTSSPEKKNTYISKNRSGSSRKLTKSLSFVNKPLNTSMTLNMSFKN